MCLKNVSAVAQTSSESDQRVVRHTRLVRRFTTDCWPQDRGQLPHCRPRSRSLTPSLQEAFDRAAATKAIKEKENFFDECQFQRFQLLPWELQGEVLRQIRRPSDIKLLRLVSKGFKEIATPLLYHDISLVVGGKYSGASAPLSEAERNRLLVKINSLLEAPQNLRFTRTLLTGRCDWWATKAMDAVLHKLQDGLLIQFDYGDFPPNLFPTQQQMEYMWMHQRNIRNLKSTHIVPGLIGFLSRYRLQPTAFSRSLTELTLSYRNRGVASEKSILWPLDNLDLTSLRSLNLMGWVHQSDIVKLNSMFSNGAFTKLKHIFFGCVKFFALVELKNCPLLESLGFAGCHSRTEHNRIECRLPETRPLRAMYFAMYQIEELLPYLARVHDLQTLYVRAFLENITDEIRSNLAAALWRHKNTLRSLTLENGYNSRGTSLVSDRSDEFQDTWLLETIEQCHLLSQLAMPLRSKKDPIEPLRRLIANLPNLSALIIYDPWRCRAYETANIVDKLMDVIPASSRLKYICFADYNQVGVARVSQCFVRQDLYRQFNESMRAGMKNGSKMGSIRSQHTESIFRGYYV